MLDQVDGRTYWGKDHKQRIIKDVLLCCKTIRCPLWCRRQTEWRLSQVSKTWLSDYVFYVRNNHPLLSICFAGHLHPLVMRSRALIECSVLSWTFLFAFSFAHPEYTAEGFAMRYIAITLVVTVPGVLIWLILYNSMLCPCIQREESCVACNHDCKYRTRLAGEMSAVPALAFSLICFGIGYYIVHACDSGGSSSAFNCLASCPIVNTQANYSSEIMSKWTNQQWCRFEITECGETFDHCSFDLTSKNITSLCQCSTDSKNYLHLFAVQCEIKVQFSPYAIRYISTR
jgi:hypothetical protein